MQELGLSAVALMQNRGLTEIPFVSAPVTKAAWLPADRMPTFARCFQPGGRKGQARGGRDAQRRQRRRRRRGASGKDTIEEY